MWPDLRQRSQALELMDDFSIGGDDLAVALHELRLINTVLASAQLTISGIRRLWQAAGQPTHLSLLDIGAGSGDLNRAVLRWADAHGVAMQIILVDLHPETCAAAAALYADEPRVRVVCSDLLTLGVRPVDIVTAALFTHHFGPQQLPHIYLAMLNAARLGVVVNDLHRHMLAWLGISVATRLLSRNRMIRHDAPLSVLRGFRAADLRELRQVAGLEHLDFSWRPLFRYLVIVPGSHYAG